MIQKIRFFSVGNEFKIASGHVIWDNPLTNRSVVDKKKVQVFHLTRSRTQSSELPGWQISYVAYEMRL